MAAAIAEPSHLAGDLKALRLSTVAAQWQHLAEQAVRQHQTPADYLAHLVHLEVTARRERRIQRRIQDARFPMLRTLDAFSFEAQPDLDRDAVLQVFNCRFVAEAANVVFVGGVGTGKTHLSIALGMACCQHDYRVRFATAAELVTLLVEAQQQGRLTRKLAQLDPYDIVIRPELGYVPLDKAGADPTAAAAVIDRIVHHATVLQTTGGSFRLAAAKQNQASGPEPAFQPADQVHFRSPPNNRVVRLRRRRPAGPSRQSHHRTDSNAGRRSAHPRSRSLVADRLAWHIAKAGSNRRATCGRGTLPVCDDPGQAIPRRGHRGELVGASLLCPGGR